MFWVNVGGFFFAFLCESVFGAMVGPSTSALFVFSMTSFAVGALINYLLLPKDTETN